MANELVVGYPSDMAHRIEDLLKENAELLDALKEIAKTEGPYSRDPKQHADNVICNMASIANKAITKAEGDA